MALALRAFDHLIVPLLTLAQARGSGAEGDPHADQLQLQLIELQEGLGKSLAALDASRDSSSEASTLCPENSRETHAIRTDSDNSKVLASLPSHGVARKGATEPDSRNSDAVAIIVNLFGDFQVTINDRPIKQWPRDKGQQIFKFLAVHRHAPQHKERLMETFWPDAEPSAARNNLNVSIYYLRQHLSRYHKTFPFVVYRNDCYALNPEIDLWIDAEEFEAHFGLAQRLDARGESAPAIEHYRRAAALIQGDFLAGDALDRWASQLAQAYRTKHLAVVDRLAEYEFKRGDFQRCAEWCQKMTLIDPCDERSHRRIIECYLRLGLRQMAMRQYLICAEILRRELDAAPAHETAQLLRQIRPNTS